VGGACGRGMHCRSVIKKYVVTDGRSRFETQRRVNYVAITFQLLMGHDITDVVPIYRSSYVMFVLGHTHSKLSYYYTNRQGECIKHRTSDSAAGLPQRSRASFAIQLAVFRSALYISKAFILLNCSLI